MRKESRTEVTFVLMPVLEGRGFSVNVGGTTHSSKTMLEYHCSQPSLQSRFLLQFNGVFSNSKRSGFFGKGVLSMCHPLESGGGTFSSKKKRKIYHFFFDN